MRFPYFLVAFFCVAIANSGADDLNSLGADDELDGGPDSVTLSNDCASVKTEGNTKIRRDGACPVPGHHKKYQERFLYLGTNHQEMVTFGEICTHVYGVPIGPDEYPRLPKSPPGPSN